VDGNGPELCPVMGFGINGVEPSGSATRMLVNGARSSWNAATWKIVSFYENGY